MDVLTLYEALPLAGKIVSKAAANTAGPCPSCGGRTGSSCGPNIRVEPRAGGSCAGGAAYRGTLWPSCGSSKA